MQTLRSKVADDDVYLVVTPQILAYAAFVAEMVKIDVPPVDYATWVDVKDRAAFVVAVEGAHGPMSYRVLVTNWDDDRLRLDAVGEFDDDHQRPGVGEKAARKLAKTFNEGQGAEG